MWDHNVALLISSSESGRFSRRQQENLPPHLQNEQYQGELILDSWQTVWHMITCKVITDRSTISSWAFFLNKDPQKNKNKSKNKNQKDRPNRWLFPPLASCLAPFEPLSQLYQRRSVTWMSGLGWVNQGKCAGTIENVRKRWGAGAGLQKSMKWF